MKLLRLPVRLRPAGTAVLPAVRAGHALPFAPTARPSRLRLASPVLNWRVDPTRGRLAAHRHVETASQPGGHPHLLSSANRRRGSSDLPRAGATDMALPYPCPAEAA